MFKQKLKKWLKRYLAAEIIGVSLVLLVSNLVMFLSSNVVLAAFAGTWSENLGFYGTIAYKDLKYRKKHRGKLTCWDYLKTLRDLIFEFGPAEYLDSFIIRPFYMILFPHLISNYSIAVLIATVLANLTYYVPTVIFYEARKKMFKD